MADGKLATINELVTLLRVDLDEPVDTATNQWTDANLIAWLNRGFRQVWQNAREAKENWFVRTLRSTDGEIVIAGQAYNPAQLAVTAGATELVLPPDFYEARDFSAIPDDGSTTPALFFDWADLGQDRFQDGRTFSPNAQTVAYTCDVRFGDDGTAARSGPRLVLSPAVADDATTADTTLTYVYAPKEYEAGDTLEASGFTPLLLDAVIAYAALEAYRQEGVPTHITIATASWLEKQQLVTRAAGPRQSRAPEVVEGFLEDWI